MPKNKEVFMSNAGLEDAEPHSILKQPIAVWALAFACTVSFMGIGLSLIHI